MRLVWIPLALIVLSLPLVLADEHASEDPAGLDGVPMALSVDADPPSPMPAGASQEIGLTIQREADGRPVAGPGRVEVRLLAGAQAGCGPEQQSVDLDPATGRGQALLLCQPTRPGLASLEVEASSPMSRTGSWRAPLDVQPDVLEGSLAISEAEGYHLPVRIDLYPRHLEQAPVNVTIEGHLAEADLGFRNEPLSIMAKEDSSMSSSVLARHGPGTYAFHAKVTGPLTHDWTMRHNLTVPEPPSEGSLSLNATVGEAEPSVALPSTSVNEDGKRKYPGDRLITRLRTAHADAVNVSVYRNEAGEPIELAQEQLAVDEEGRAEHVFAHEPLPAQRLWVQAQTGESSVARTAIIRDASASAEIEGSGQVLADGRAWEGTLHLFDRNFGSTSMDSGPIFGLPNLTWTVYKGLSYRPEGFQVTLGPFSGPGEGQAATDRIPWPQGAQGVDVAPGQASFPLLVEPPADVDPGSYRISVYDGDGDRLGGEAWELIAPPRPVLEVGQPVPGKPLAIDLAIEDAVEDTSVDVRVLVDDQPIANATRETNASLEIQLPSPIPAGRNVEVQAWAHWPGRPATQAPDALVVETVPELPPNVSVHPMVDGMPAQAPLSLHPAHPHEIELVYQALDPHEGPLDAGNLTVSVHGPAGPVAWETNLSAASIVVDVPADIPPGAYEILIEAAGSKATGQERMPLEIASTLRLHLEGPEDITLKQGATREVKLVVANRGSLPVEQITPFVQTELDLEARVSNGTEWQPAGTTLGHPLAPGESAELVLELTPNGASGSGRIDVIVAGVVE